MSMTANNGSNECENCGDTSSRLINGYCPSCQGGQFRDDF